MTDQNIDLLNNLVEKLKAAGEDAAEMKFWQEIFHALNPQQQNELLEILKTELSKLETTR
ncbi:MAG: hypothetical protein Q8N81_07095 [bacterium]|nr:hypothetical protein [bacterium]